MYQTNDTISYWYGLNGKLLAETGQTGNEKEYVYLNGEPIAVFTRLPAPRCDGPFGCFNDQTDNQHPGSPGFGQYWSTHYVHNDHLGTPQRVTDENATIVWQAIYNPFGEADIIMPNGAKFRLNLRFPGQYFDQESRLSLNKQYKVSIKHTLIVIHVRQVCIFGYRVAKIRKI